MTKATKRHGSCLCGDVHFEVELELAKGSRCNCTLCTKLGATGSLLKPAAFTLLSGESKLASFTRTPEIGHRFFCARCHIYCFGKGHLEMLGGDFVSVTSTASTTSTSLRPSSSTGTGATTTGTPGRVLRHGRSSPPRTPDHEA